MDTANTYVKTTILNEKKHLFINIHSLFINTWYNRSSACKDSEAQGRVRLEVVCVHVHVLIHYFPQNPYGIQKN